MSNTYHNLPDNVVKAVTVHNDTYYWNSVEKKWDYARPPVPNAEHDADAFSLREAVKAWYGQHCTITLEPYADEQQA